MTWAEEAGLGELGLMPAQFWSLTIREFQLKWDGFLRAEKRAEWLVGRHAQLMNRYGKDGKDRPSVSRILGYRQSINRYPIKPWLLRRGSQQNS